MRRRLFFQKSHCFQVPCKCRVHFWIPASPIRRPCLQSSFLNPSPSPRVYLTLAKDPAAGSSIRPIARMLAAGKRCDAGFRAAHWWYAAWVKLAANLRFEEESGDMETFSPQRNLLKPLDVYILFYFLLRSPRTHFLGLLISCIMTGWSGIGLQAEKPAWPSRFAAPL